MSRKHSKSKNTIVFLFLVVIIPCGIVFVSDIIGAIGDTVHSYEQSCETVKKRIGFRIDEHTEDYKSYVVCDSTP